MKRMDYVHPIILFLYFMMVIFITMITNNPVLISISFFSSLFLYAMFTKSQNMFKKLGLFFNFNDFYGFNKSHFFSLW